MKPHRANRTSHHPALRTASSSISIALTDQECNELAWLTNQESSAMAFWLSAYRSRGIVIPARTVPRATNTARGEYTLSFDTIALGPAAIAKGRAYAIFAAEMDAKMEAKLKASNPFFRPRY